MKTKSTPAGCRTAPPCSAAVLARKIARDIMTIQGHRGPIRCQRAVMMRGKYPHEECDMGGRNTKSMADVIARHLIASGYPLNP